MSSLGKLRPLGADKYAEYCSDILSSGQYLLDVINDILDMAKIEAGRIRLDFEELDLDTLLAEAMRVVSARAQDKQLELVAKISPHLSLRADRRAFKQIVLNLLSNAVKFTPRHGVVSLRIESVATGDVALVIADTGIGIDATALRVLCEPFVQADASIGRKFGGSGLGLAITRKLLGLHGGTLSIESTQGEGTTVRAIFPRERLVQPAVEVMRETALSG